MATGAKLWCPYFLGLYAEQLGKAGRAKEGLGRDQPALALAGTSGEHYAMPVLDGMKRTLIAEANRSDKSWKAAQAIAC